MFHSAGGIVTLRPFWTFRPLPRGSQRNSPCRSGCGRSGIAIHGRSRGGRRAREYGRCFWVAAADQAGAKARLAPEPDGATSAGGTAGSTSSGAGGSAELRPDGSGGTAVGGSGGTASGGAGGTAFGGAGWHEDRGLGRGGRNRHRRRRRHRVGGSGGTAPGALAAQAQADRAAVGRRRPAAQPPAAGSPAGHPLGAQALGDWPPGGTGGLGGTGGADGGTAGCATDCSAISCGTGLRPYCDPIVHQCCASLDCSSIPVDVGRARAARVSVPPAGRACAWVRA